MDRNNKRTLEKYLQELKKEKGLKEDDFIFSCRNKMTWTARFKDYAEALGLSFEEYSFSSTRRRILENWKTNKCFNRFIDWAETKTSIYFYTQDQNGFANTLIALSEEFRYSEDIAENKGSEQNK